LSQPRKRPGAWWLFFYGRRRRGFPWLLVGVFAAVLVLALLFAIPGGSDLSWAVAGVAFGLLIGGAVVLAVVAVLRPRRRP
jgi:Na+/melibiose symporter-like transporter